jgi:hypothetical protein
VFSPVPWKWWIGILSINCENQENQHPQLATLITQENQHSQPTSTPTQQQCHLLTTTIQSSTIINKTSNLKAKWTNRQLEDAMDVTERGHASLRKSSKYWNIVIHLTFRSPQW